MTKVFLVLLTIVCMLAGCGGGAPFPPVTLTSISVTPVNTSIAPGTTAQFRAVGIFSDHATRDLTTSVTWSSSDAGIATISNSQGTKGLATAVAAGSSTITATSGNISGSTIITPAALVSIAVTPTNPTSIVGTTQQFTATGILSNNATQDLTSLVAWSSSNTGIATISSGGITTAVAAGSTVITATFTGVSGTTTLTAVTVVSIAIIPTNPVIAVGTTQQFSATGTLSNNTTKDVTSLVTWGSSNAGVATISAGGIASSISIGSTTISAIFAGVSGTTTMTVQGPVSITVTPANSSSAVGSTLQFTATGSFSDGSVRDLTTLVTWSSSAGGVASISNASGSNGLATAVAAGSTTITAALGVSGSTTLTVKALVAIAVTPVNPTMGLGSTLQFAATGTFADGSIQDLTASVTWSSTDSGVAVVSNVQGSKGLVTANGFGSAGITGTFGGISGSTTLIVTQTNRAYVANGLSNTLSVIDTANNVAVATIGVGAGPRGVAVNSAASRIYVTNSLSNTLSVIDTTSNTVVATIGVGAGPQGVAVNPAANLAYAANGNSNTLSVIDTASNTAVATIAVGAGPQGVAVNPAAGRVYVTNSLSNTLSVIDTTSNTAVATIGVGAGPRGVAVNPAANLAYAANSNSNTLSVIDTTSNTVVATIGVGAGPRGVAINPAANLAYAANSNSNTLSVIDTTSNTLVADVGVGAGPQDVAVNPAASRVYVTNSLSNTLSVIDTTTNTVVATVAVDAGPQGVAVIP
jgi:YVTN family beta-propeller protein